MNNEVNQEQYLEQLIKKFSLFDQVPLELKDDKIFMLKVIDIIPSGQEFYIQTMSDRLKDDKEVALKMVTRNFLYMSYISPRLMKDKEIALVCVKQEKGDLAYLHFELWDELKANGSLEKEEAIKYLEKMLLKEELKTELIGNSNETRKHKI